MSCLFRGLRLRCGSMRQTLPLQPAFAPLGGSGQAVKVPPQRSQHDVGTTGHRPSGQRSKSRSIMRNCWQPPLPSLRDSLAAGFLAPLECAGAFPRGFHGFSRMGGPSNSSYRCESVSSVANSEPTDRGPIKAAQGCTSLHKVRIFFDGAELCGRSGSPSENSPAKVCAFCAM
jgi:hypothetical protein